MVDEGGQKVVRREEARIYYLKLCTNPTGVHWHTIAESHVPVKRSKIETILVKEEVAGGSITNVTRTLVVQRLSQSALSRSMVIDGRTS